MSGLSANIWEKSAVRRAAAAPRDGGISLERIEDFFHDLVAAAATRTGILPDAVVGGYLVELMTSGMNPSLYVNPKAEDGTPLTLAESLLGARAACGRARLGLLKFTGDRALFIAGLCPESLERKIVGVDYYRTMGVTAYAELSSAYGRFSMNGSFFSKMAKCFDDNLRLLAEVSEHVFHDEKQAVVTMVNKWLISGSPSAYRRLQERGISVLQPVSLAIS